MRKRRAPYKADRVKAQITEIRERVAYLTDGWGRFVEGLVQPCVPELFKTLGIELSETAESRKKHKDDDTLEVDVLAVGDEHVVAVSVKTTLSRKDDVDDLERDLGRFFDFFPEYRGRRLLGAMAGITVRGGVDRYAESKGFYVLTPAGHAMKLANSKGFKPRVWNA
ncbi:MAG: DUF3782 domain-containing protein [Nitrospirae bacterium]|nr:DUF3782 domain-containing protein [Nitrospirota bacterium]